MPAIQVPGDVIHLRAGDLIPADGRLLSAKDLFLNEAALTGESLPREKHAPAQRGTRRFGFLILQAVVFLVLFVFLVNALLRPA